MWRAWEWQLVVTASIQKGWFMVLTRKNIWEFMGRKKKKPKESKGLTLLKRVHINGYSYHIR